MAEQPERLSLGRYLQTLRVKKGLGLDEVSRRTHISRQNLINIEEGNYASLPAPVHVKGFLRTYSQLLKVNPDRVVQHYTEDLMTWKDPDGIYRLSGRFGFWPRFIFAVGMLVGIISLTLYSLSFWGRSPDGASATAPNIKHPAPAGARAKRPLEMPGINNGNRVLAERGGSAEENHLKLEVITLDSTKLKVIIDGQAPLTYRLEPEDRLELDASSHFNLLLDNAQGIELYFNEEPITLSGRAGQNVTIQLP